MEQRGPGQGCLGLRFMIQRCERYGGQRFLEHSGEKAHMCTHSGEKFYVTELWALCFLEHLPADVPALPCFTLTMKFNAVVHFALQQFAM